MKKSIFGFSIIILIMSVTPAFSGTTISFSNNISGEFPDAATYNRFTSNLSDAFSNGIKYQTNFLYNTHISISQAHIVDQVEKFSFYAFGGIIAGHTDVTSGDSLEKIKYGGIDSSYNITGAFGFKLKDNLSLYLTIGAMQSLIPIGINVLWKILDVVKENSDNGRKTTQRLFFSPGLVFAFLENRYYEGSTEVSNSLGSFPYISGNSGSYYSFDGGNGKLTITYPVEITKFRRTIFSLDLSIKYHLKYSFFNLYAVIGATIHINHVQEHFKVLTTNVNYTGGSPTGIDTTLEVNSDVKWVNIMPHFSVGLQFEILKWLTLRIPFVAVVYLPADKRFILSLNFGLGVTF